MSENALRTVTVKGSRVVARADNRVAIMLDFVETAPIALEVTLQTIAILQSELAKAETILRSQTGKA
jgi:hypothetical protein